MTIVKIFGSRIGTEVFEKDVFSRQSNLGEKLDGVSDEATRATEHKMKELQKRIAN